MPLFDRVKSGAAQAVQKAQEAGKAGQAKIDEMQAARRLDALMRELGAAVYAQHAARATDETAGTIKRLYGEIAAHEAEHGGDSGDTSADDNAATPNDSAAAGGDFKLD